MNIGMGKATLDLGYSTENIYDLREGSVDIMALLGLFEGGFSFDPVTGQFEGFSVGMGIAPGGVIGFLKALASKQHKLLDAYVNNMISVGLSENSQVGILFDECSCE